MRALRPDSGHPGDQVAAQALGLPKIVNEESVRHALSAVDSKAAQQWMRRRFRQRFMLYVPRPKTTS